MFFPNLYINFPNYDNEFRASEGAEILREDLLLLIDKEHVEGSGNGDLHPKMSVRNLQKKLDEGRRLLSGVLVDIWKGTVVGVISPSSSGKSTIGHSPCCPWHS